MLDEFMYRNHQCLVQECLGDNLRVIIAKHDQEDLSLWLIQKLLRDLLGSLEILHSHGYIHADVKLTNVLWSPQDGCAKLIDLGLTFHTSDYEVAHAVQASFYRAPETWLRMKQLEKMAVPEATSAYSWTEWLYDEEITQTNVKSTPQASKSSHRKQRRPFKSDQPIQLTSAIDIWSVGRVILQLITCGKVHIHGEERRDFCKNCCMIDTSLRCEYATNVSEALIRKREVDTMENANIAINDLRDLTRRMLLCRPEDRITAEEALEHPFFAHTLEAAYQDSAILPSRVLCLLNMIDQDCESLSQNESEDILDDIKSECVQFGPVEKCIFGQEPGSYGKVLALYTDAKHCIEAWNKLNGRTFNHRTVITTYYPYDLFKQTQESNSLVN
ncbi:serine/threonine-protein kinase Kist-like isoform X2 [Tubulanus polymorphus]